LTDFTGGITEGYIIRGPNSDVPRNIVNVLFKALDRQSLIGCGINVGGFCFGILWSTLIVVPILKFA